MDSPGFQITPVMRLAVLLGLVWSVVAIALASAGFGIDAFFAVAVLAAPLDVYLLRRSGGNTYHSPDHPPRRASTRLPTTSRERATTPRADDARSGDEAAARR